MTIFFISRHPGAIEWVREEGVLVDCFIEHLDIDRVKPGDCVIGSLPVNLAAQVCRRQARYIHMSVSLPKEWRGRELSADQLRQFGAVLEGYVIEKG